MPTCSQVLFSALSSKAREQFFQQGHPCGLKSPVETGVENIDFGSDFLVWILALLLTVQTHNFSLCVQCFLVCKICLLCCFERIEWLPVWTSLQSLFPLLLLFPQLPVTITTLETISGQRDKVHLTHSFVVSAHNQWTCGSSWGSTHGRRGLMSRKEMKVWGPCSPLHRHVPWPKDLSLDSTFKIATISKQCQAGDQVAPHLRLWGPLWSKL
jgi:hypothetical protein